MTPEAEAVLHYEIGQVLRGLSVRNDVEATAAARKAGGPRSATVLYAVWDSRCVTTSRVSEPAPHLQAQADRIRLQSEAIIQLIKELAPDARAAD